MLDIAQRVLETDGVRCVRVDGSVPVGERAKRITRFQSAKKRQAVASGARPLMPWQANTTSCC